MSDFQSDRALHDLSDAQFRHSQANAVLQSTPDTLRVLRVIWLRKWHIAACAFFVGLAAFTLAARQPEQFTAQTTVLLDARKSNLVLKTDQIVSDLEFSNAVVESEIARLASHSAIAKVVAEIGYKKLTFLDPGPDSQTGLIGRIDRFKSNLSPDLAPNSFSTKAPDRGLFRITRAIAKGTSAQRVGSSFVIRLSVTTKDPNASAIMANRLTEFYLQQQIDERQEIAEQTADWHERQVARRLNEFVMAEQHLEDLRRQHLKGTGSSMELLDQQLAELNRAYAEIEGELVAAQTAFSQFLLERQVKTPRAIAQAQRSEPFVTLIETDEELRSSYRKLAAQLGENHPDLRANADELQLVKARIETSVEQLQTSLRNEIDLISARKAALQASMDELQERQLIMLAETRELRRAEIDATSARQSYEDLASRLSDIRSQTELQRSDARILSFAEVPTGPSAPRPKFMGAFGASIGASLGLFSVLIFEALGRGVGSSEELATLIRSEDVIAIPKVSLKSPLIILNCLKGAIRHPVVERLRQVQSVLSFKGGAESQVIMVTSAIPKEGKSTVAIGLAQVWASAGHRTLLIPVNGDLPSDSAEDLKRPPNSAAEPDLHKKGFKFRNVRDGNFDVFIPHGESSYDWQQSVPGDVSILRRHYDAIILDGPDLLAQSSGLRLARVADHLVFVVGFLSTPKRSVQMCLTLLQSLSLRPSIALLNKVDARLDPDVSI